MKLDGKLEGGWWQNGGASTRGRAQPGGCWGGGQSRAGEQPRGAAGSLRNLVC